MKVQHGCDDDEYRKICKTIRKNMRQDIRRYNVETIKKAISQNKSVKATQIRLKEGKPLMTTIKAADGKIITGKLQVLERCAEFYEKLYSSSANRPAVTPSAQDNVLPDEVQLAMNQMKNNKATGDDEIPIDMLKLGGYITCRKIARLFTSCLRNKCTPNNWGNAVIILLHKKGDKLDVNNYRPISLISHMCKLFTKIIKNRIERQLDDNQPREQAGFRGRYSTSDHLQVITQLIEKTNEYNLPLCLGFVDYEKAFDSVEHHGIMDALDRHQVHKTYIELLTNLYNGCTSQIRLHGEDSKKFPIMRGVKLTN